MGWGLCMAVVEGLSAEEIAARLDMDLTEDRVAYYTGALHMVGLRRDGRGLVVMDTGADVMPLADERLLARLSRGTRVMVFEINETIDRYAVSCWASGVMDWKVTHSHEDSETEELEVLGVPPKVFEAIAEWYRAKQIEADAVGDNIHYYSSVVIDLFISLTDIRYNASGWWEDLDYRALRPRHHGKPDGSLGSA
jgi:hypothetical protein